jgi:hypothetical protein
MEINMDTTLYISFYILNVLYPTYGLISVGLVAFSKYQQVRVRRCCLLSTTVSHRKGKGISFCSTETNRIICWND